MTKDEQPGKPVWSTSVSVSEIPPHGADFTIEADAAQRDALAKINGLVALASVVAKLHVTHRGRDGLHVTGEVRARATQTCVVTLEPFEADIVEPVDVEFEAARSLRPQRDDRERTSRRRRDVRPPIVEDEEGMDDLDAPDEIVDGRIDIGALAAEFLTLGLDPYPRKPGVAFAEPAAPTVAVSPFAGLASRKSEPGDKA